jgi:hypothetical protein
MKVFRAQWSAAAQDPESAMKQFHSNKAKKIPGEIPNETIRCPTIML